MGTKAISTARSLYKMVSHDQPIKKPVATYTTGNKPVTTPRMTGGIELMKPKKGTLFVKYY
jgi:hypothetical protein